MNKKSAIHNRSDAIEPIEIKEIPIPLGAKHPPVPHNVLPQHEFSIGLVAPKGAGKTTLMCNIIKNYAGYFHSIIVFSPSVKNDEKWDWVRKQKLLAENTRLLEWIKEMKEKQVLL